MTREADIDFTFESAITIGQAIEHLRSECLTFDSGGTIFYALDSGEINWVDAPSSQLHDVIHSADVADPKRKVFAVTCYFNDTDIGGELLFHQGRLEVSFTATINRRRLFGTSKFTDFSWYLQKLVPALEPLALKEITSTDRE